MGIQNTVSRILLAEKKRKKEKNKIEIEREDLEIRIDSLK